MPIFIHSLGACIHTNKPSKSNNIAIDELQSYIHNTSGVYSTHLHNTAWTSTCDTVYKCMDVCYGTMFNRNSEFWLYTSLNAAPEIPQVLTVQIMKYVSLEEFSTITAQLYTSLKTGQLYTNISITCYFTG